MIWDNRCILHRGTTFADLEHRRDLRRATINEHGPERSFIDPARAFIDGPQS